MRYSGKPLGYEKYFRFDATGYKDNLRKVLLIALTKTRDDMYVHIKENLSEIEFSDNEVTMLRGGGVYRTSDLQRKKAVIDSIYRDKVRQLSSNSKIVTAIKALGKNWKDDHIGMYYEYGTGEYRTSRHFAGEGKYWNPFRTSKTIVTRSVFSTHMDSYSKWGYSGLRQQNKQQLFVNGQRWGSWIDMGGNTRLTRSAWGGERTPKMEEKIGDGTMAEYWFSGSFLTQKGNLTRDLRNSLVKNIKKALNDSDIFKYFTIKDIKF